MRQVSWAERQIRRVDRFQQRHAVLAFPWAVVQKFGDDQAGSKAALMPVIGDQIRSDVHPLEGNTTALIIGILGTIYGSLGIGFAAQNAMNKVWNIPYVRWPSFWERYARTFGVIGLLGVASVSSTVLATIATAFASGATATALAVAGSAVLNLGLFLLAFKVLSAEPLRAREVAVGAILATVFWETLQLVGTWYVTRGLRHAGPTYGFFAVVITLLSWLYLGSQLTLWAAEINVVLRYRLWPRSLMRPPLTAADKLMLVRLAEMEVRRPEQKITTSFTDKADEDPLRSTPEPRQAPP
jgi:YihY family inner membrane protein